MTFGTSYFANIKNIRTNHPDYILVSISLNTTPELDRSVDFSDKRLSPTPFILNDYKGNPNEIEYVKRFKAVLQNIDLNSILKEWASKYGANKKYILICYEKPSDFCHRHIIAEEIENKYNIEVPEIDIDLNKYYRKDYKYNLNQVKYEEW